MGYEKYGPPPSGAPQDGHMQEALRAQFAAPAGARSAATERVPATSRRNWMAITAFLLVLVGAGPIGVVFAILGLFAARRGLATNRRLAATALVLNLAASVVLIIVVVDPGDTSGLGSVSYADIAVGDCVRQPRGFKEEGGELASQYVGRASCDTAHWGQVYYLDALKGNVYPGDDAIELSAEGLCYSSLRGPTSTQRASIRPSSRTSCPRKTRGTPLIAP